MKIRTVGAVVCGCTMLALAGMGATPHKKVPAKGAHAAKASASKTSKSKKQASPASWRTRQLIPTPDRYREIQQALSDKGYLPAEQVNGQWNDASTDALKRFQTDQNLDATGKINSLSLIALGLGPKHDTQAGASPSSSTASQ